MQQQHDQLRRRGGGGGGAGGGGGGGCGGGGAVGRYDDLYENFSDCPKDWERSIPRAIIIITMGVPASLASSAASPSPSSAA